MADDHRIERHRQSVIALSKPGEPLAQDAAHATVRNPDWFVRQPGGIWRPKSARANLHNRLIAEQKETAPNAGNDRESIVLAGPPGAGKSTVLGAILGTRRDQFLVIDADEFKRALLLEAQRDGTYESKIKPPEIHAREAAGERFFPLELASLVHEESSMLAARLRGEAIREGTNIVIDTVLSSSKSALELGRQLDAAGYSVEVLDVEVPFAISEERIAKRWQQSYEDALDGREPLGGRWVPSEYARDVFNGPTGRSKPEEAARGLAADCPAVGRYRVYRTTQETAATTQSIGSWETDLSRQQRGGPLLDTPGATAPSKPTAVLTPTESLSPELRELQRLRAVANGAATGVNKNKPAPTRKPPTATGSRAPDEKSRQR